MSTSQVKEGNERTGFSYKQSVKDKSSKVPIPRPVPSGVSLLTFQERQCQKYSSVVLLRDLLCHFGGNNTQGTIHEPEAEPIWKASLIPLRTEDERAHMRTNHFATLVLFTHRHGVPWAAVFRGQ